MSSAQKNQLISWSGFTASVSKASKCSARVLALPGASWPSGISFSSPPLMLYVRPKRVRPKSSSNSAANSTSSTGDTCWSPRGLATRMTGGLLAYTAISMLGAILLGRPAASVSSSFQILLWVSAMGGSSARGWPGRTFSSMTSSLAPVRRACCTGLLR